jgi:hypothetical protein
MEVIGVVPRPPPLIGQPPGQRVVHTAAQTSAPLTIPAVAGVPSMEIATVSGEGHCVKNLGYYLNTSLDWTRQWLDLQAKRAQRPWSCARQQQAGHATWPSLRCSPNTMCAPTYLTS